MAHTQQTHKCTDTQPQSRTDTHTQTHRQADIISACNDVSHSWVLSVLSSCRVNVVVASVSRTSPVPSACLAAPSLKPPTGTWVVVRAALNSTTRRLPRTALPPTALPPTALPHGARRFYRTWLLAYSCAANVASSAVTVARASLPAPWSFGSRDGGCRARTRHMRMLQRTYTNRRWHTRMVTLTHSLTHSLPHSLTPSLPHSLTQSMWDAATEQRLPQDHVCRSSAARHQHNSHNRTHSHTDKGAHTYTHGYIHTQQRHAHIHAHKHAHNTPCTQTHT
jgi:hypothetical protein